MSSQRVFCYENSTEGGKIDLSLIYVDFTRYKN